MVYFWRSFFLVVSEADLRDWMNVARRECSCLELDGRSLLYMRLRVGKESSTKDQNQNREPQCFLRGLPYFQNYHLKSVRKAYIKIMCESIIYHKRKKALVQRTESCVSTGDHAGK